MQGKCVVCGKETEHIVKLTAEKTGHLCVGCGKDIRTKA